MKVQNQAKKWMLTNMLKLKFTIKIQMNINKKKPIPIMVPNHTLLPPTQNPILNKTRALNNAMKAQVIEEELTNNIHKFHNNFLKLIANKLLVSKNFDVRFN